MGFIKNLVGTALTFLVGGAAIVFGYSAGTTIWENGLGDKVAEKTQKTFSKKED